MLYPVDALRDTFADARMNGVSILPSRIEAKRELLRRLRAKAGELRGLLQTYLSGERRTFGQDHVETTEEGMAQLEREVAALEKTIAALEKQVSE